MCWSVSACREANDRTSDLNWQMMSRQRTPAKSNMSKRETESIRGVLMFVQHWDQWRHVQREALSQENDNSLR